MLESPVSPNVSGQVERYSEIFRKALPVRHVVIDDFLQPDYAKLLYADLPDPNVMPKSRDYMFSEKRELSTLDRHSEISRRLHHVFVSEEFSDFLGVIAGQRVFLDPEYVGGGFHAGSGDSFLDLHVDFNIHPSNDGWKRELNILLYLNPGWEQSWGGELLLTNDPATTPIAVEPLFNRLVIMESTDRSFHGYKVLNFPQGRARRSIAAYAYSQIDSGSVKRRTTNWVPQNAGLLKRTLARNWNWIVLSKNKVLGSGTLKNRR